MLTIRVISDAHLEFHGHTFLVQGTTATNEILKFLPSSPIDSESVLVVAGDLASATQPGRIITFLDHVLPRFKHVIYVLGNHEHYGGDVTKTQAVINAVVAAKLGACANLTIVGNNTDEVTVDGVRFICATLWTDYAASLPNRDYIRQIVSCYINDHRAINIGDSAASPAALSSIFEATVGEFGRRLRGNDNSRTVIVTHHMPSFSAVHPMYKSDDTITRCLNHAFASDLDDFINEHRPVAWLFGHTHTSYHSNVGDTQLICNPRGYPKERSLDGWEFNPHKAIMV